MAARTSSGTRSAYAARTSFGTCPGYGARTITGTISAYGARFSPGTASSPGRANPIRNPRRLGLPLRGQPATLWP